ncbi:hypothetical protein BH11CYA1_BH11CYA1_27510 [soil metagenome]
MVETKAIKTMPMLDVYGRPTETMILEGLLVRLETQVEISPTQRSRFDSQPGHQLCYVYFDGCLRWVPNEALDALAIAAQVALSQGPAVENVEVRPVRPQPVRRILSGMKADVQAFQLSASDMWANFTQMMRVVNSANGDLPAEQMLLAMSLYSSTSDMLVLAGGAICCLRGAESVQLSRLPDDVAAIRISTFYATVRQDRVFDEQIMAQAKTFEQSCEGLGDTAREACLSALSSSFLSAAMLLLLNFQHAVVALSQSE